MELINGTPFQFAYIEGRINFPRHSLTLLVKSTFDLKPNQKTQPSDNQVFPTGDEFAPEDEEKTGSVQYESDFAYFKPCADLLLTGKCHAPGGNAVKQCDVTFQVGEKRRTLSVSGHRYWEHTLGGGSISEATPFIEMPIGYQNAFGGEDYKFNPLGKGADRGKLLPNVEDPSKLIASVNDRPDPAGFGPLHRMWEQRTSKLGTYTGDYLKKRWPWFAEDFDWSYFNAAPAEMRLEGYLSGDEKLAFENLHPHYSNYETQLPGIRLRCFKRTIEAEANTPFFEEVTMHLDTLWVNMQAEQLVLVWRGWTEVASEEFDEITHIYVMSEAIDQAPVTAEQAHLQFKEMQAELEKEWGMPPEAPEELNKEAADAIVPESIKSAAEGAIKQVVAEETQAPLLDGKGLQAQVNKLFSQLGIDVDGLPAEAKKLIQEQHTKILNRLTESDPAKLAQLESQELQAQLKAGLAKLDIDMDKLPPVSEKAKLEQLRFMQELGFEEESLVGSEELGQLWELTSALLPKMSIDPEDLTPLIEQVKKQKVKINKQLGVEPISAEKLQELTTEAELQANKNDDIKARASRGESFAGEDLSGLDLSGLDLKGLDFTAAILSGANLQNSDLTGAKLNEAKLVNANLAIAKLNEVQMSAADCTNADLSCVECVAANMSASIFTNAKIIGANLSESDLSVANLYGSDLSGSKFVNSNMALANLSKANLNNVNLFGADLSDAIFEYAQLIDAKLDQITATDAIFSAANLSNCRFVEAKLSGADFSAAVLNDANFQGADLSEASMEKVTAKNINFSHANLEKLRASEGSDFSGAMLEQAKGKESIWHEAILDGADFKFSKMEGADFSKASLQNIRCYGADMRFSRFIKANLSSAKMLEMNLFKGSLEKANLNGTVFNGSNLYGVEFFEAQLDNTKLGDANVKATKLQKVI